MTADLRNNVVYQTAADIRELAREMVDLDWQMSRTYEREEWFTYGEYLRRREAVQQRRSQLLREQWLWRRGRR